MISIFSQLLIFQNFSKFCSFDSSFLFPSFILKYYFALLWRLILFDLFTLLKKDLHFFGLKENSLIFFFFSLLFQKIKMFRVTFYISKNCSFVSISDLFSSRNNYIYINFFLLKDRWESRHHKTFFPHWSIRACDISKEGSVRWTTLVTFYVDNPGNGLSPFYLRHFNTDLKYHFSSHLPVVNLLHDILYNVILPPRL